MSAIRRKSRFHPHFEALEHRYAPAIFNVTTTLDVVDAGDGLVSLREAINDANATAEQDRIVLPAGTFAIQIPDNSDEANLTGDFDITNPVILKGASAGSTLIDADGLDRAFHILGPASGGFPVKFRRMTIQNGHDENAFGGAIFVEDASTTSFSNLVVRKVNLLNNFSDGSGGAIGFQGAGNVTLRECQVVGNMGFRGGAVFTSAVGSFQGNITALNCLFSDNFAESHGGGLFTSGNVTLTNTTLSGNDAGGSGGALHEAGAGKTINLVNCTVTENAAVLEGGGIRAGSATATLTDCTISGNRSLTDSGGGLHGDVGSTLSLDRCTVADNFSDSSGGGIFTAANLTVTNSTISGNRAASDAGGINAGFGSLVIELANVTITGNMGDGTGGLLLAMDATGGSANLLNVTITGNSGENTGGVSDFSAAPITVKNSLIARNRVANDTQEEADVNSGSEFVSLGHNLIGISDGSNGFLDGTNGDQVGTEAAPLDPQLLALANNGGPTKTHALQPTSTAIDAGDNTGVPATDQRGQGRIGDGDLDTIATVDIGAFEL